MDDIQQKQLNIWTLGFDDDDDDDDETKNLYSASS